MSNRTHLVAFDAMGVPMKRGDTMLDFRGERAIFIEATRARVPGKTGKVLVTWVGDEKSKQREYYDTVFELHVKEVSEEESEVIGRFHYDGDMTYDQHQMYIDAEHNV